MKLFAPLMVGRNKRYRPILASAVARAMVETAKKDMPGVHIYESDELQMRITGVKPVSPRSQLI